VGDVLVNNTGIFVPKAFVEYTPEAFQRMVSTNLAGFFYVTQEAALHMLERGGGQIITISETLARQSARCSNRNGSHMSTHAASIRFRCRLTNWVRKYSSSVSFLRSLRNHSGSAVAHHRQELVFLAPVDLIDTHLP
jgi:NAD(P)-dependent dehydrogenase (short-subunit alcohol dehydrogenase family)